VVLHGDGRKTHLEFTHQLAHLLCPLFAVLVQRIRRTEENISRRRYLGLGIGASGSRYSWDWTCARFDHLDRTHDGGLSRVLLRTDDSGDEVGARSGRRRRCRRDGVRGVVLDSLGRRSLARQCLGETWSCMAVLSVVCTAAAFLVFFELVKEVGSSRSVVVTYFNTAIAVVLGVVGLHETLTSGIIFGFPLVLVGCILATSGPKVPPTSELLGVLSGDADLAVDQQPE